MATQKKNPTILRKSVEGIKRRVKGLHHMAYETTDHLVDGSLATGNKWQKISAKAIKNGSYIFDKQQDLVFESLITLKGQYKKGNRQFRQLFDLGLKKESVKKNIAKKKSTKNSVDLKLIAGIGPKLEKMLNTFGIKDIESLATIDLKSLKAFLAKAGPSFKSLDPAKWVKEARTFLKK